MHPTPCHRFEKRVERHLLKGGRENSLTWPLFKPTAIPVRSFAISTDGDEMDDVVLMALSRHVQIDFVDVESSGARFLRGVLVGCLVRTRI